MTQVSHPPEDQPKWMLKARYDRDHQQCGEWHEYSNLHVTYGHRYSWAFMDLELQDELEGLLQPDTVAIVLCEDTFGLIEGFELDLPRLDEFAERIKHLRLHHETS